MTVYPFQDSGTSDFQSMPRGGKQPGAALSASSKSRFNGEMKLD
ncbi:hypothetical protein NPIL_608931, partial [Nephila pilipes]